MANENNSNSDKFKFGDFVIYLPNEKTYQIVADKNSKKQNLGAPSGEIPPPGYDFALIEVGAEKWDAFVYANFDEIVPLPKE